MSAGFKSLFKDLTKSLLGPSSIILTGNLNLSVLDVIFTARQNSDVIFKLSPSQTKKIQIVHEEMLKQVELGVPIYGTNTAYGGRVGLVLNHGSSISRFELAKKVSQSIVHVDVSTGPSIPKDIVRGAILIRLNSLLAGHSAIRLEVLEILKELLNKKITPIIGQFGSLGASGDLALNGRILSALLQLNEVKVWDKNGKIRNSSYLRKLGFKPPQLLPKEGLALANGDNFSTSAALLLTYDLSFLMLINTITSSLTIQALRGSLRNFHPLLSSLRPLPGQRLVSKLLVALLTNSKLAYQDLVEPIFEKGGQPVQDPYSIRCLPQYYGSDWESIAEFWETLSVYINSVSDNPLWTTPEFIIKNEKPYQWVSGGNFLAMYITEIIDRLRKIAVHVVKQNDRHLARLVHPHFNNGLPANLSDKNAVSQTTFKGLQNQMGMYEVYASLLTAPVSTAFGTHEEFNQDITSHAFTSYIFAKDLIGIVKYSIATNLIASCQAIDLRGGSGLLSPITKPFYEFVRREVPYIKREQPLGYYIEKLSAKLLGPEFKELIIKFLRTIDIDS